METTTIKIKISMPRPTLKPHHQLFHDTLLNNLPPETGTYHTNDPTTTHITIPTNQRNELPQTPHLITITWNQEHIQIINHQQNTHHKINRANPNWINQIHQIIQTAKNHYHKHNNPCTHSTKSSKQTSKPKTTP